MTSVYGPILTEADVRAAVTATLRLWVPTYVAEMERQTGLTLPAIRSYGVEVPADSTADQFPACVVVAPGSSGGPEVLGDGTINVPWSVGVGIVVAAEQRDTALTLAGAYTAGLRALILQNGDLGGFATSTQWLDEEVTQIAWELDLAVAAGRLQFRVVVPSMVNRRGGLPTPPLVPTAPSSTTPVATTGVTLTRTPT